MQQYRLLHKENTNVSFADSVICFKILKSWWFHSGESEEIGFQHDFLSFRESVVEDNTLSNQKMLSLRAAIHCHVNKTFKFVYVFQNFCKLFTKIFYSALKIIHED